MISQTIALIFQITERMITSSLKDDDYVRERVAVMANWTNKFMNDKSTIKTYRVYISTTPGGMLVDKLFILKPYMNPST